MKPILYNKLKTTFTNDYIGILTDVISCFVKEERNDSYELEMTYPVNGAYYDSIEQDAIIKALPNSQDEPQPFRIYKIVKNSTGIITVYARHIVYDLSKVTVEPFTSTGTIQNAIQGMMVHSIPSCGFIFETNKTTAGNYKVSVPSSFRSLMGGTRGSLLDVFGTGEYHYDGYNIYLNQNRGQNRGVVIKYGLNMIDMKQEEECDSVYTAVYPFSINDGVYTTLPERIISVEGQYPFSRIMPLDLSSEFNGIPTDAQIRTAARQYIRDHDIGIPSVNLDVEFAMSDAEQDIYLCDIVTVQFEQYGISATAKCMSLTYDSLNERVKSVRLGDYKYKFIDAIVDEIKGKNDVVELAPSMIEEVIEKICLNDEGYVLLHSSTNSDHADEILILTGTDKLNLVQKLWRWNRGGLGYSSTGYNGTYGTAITNDGRIVAGYVKTGRLVAIQINRSGNNFYVTRNGEMYAKKGYLISQTTGVGFVIDSTSVWNQNISLMNLGVRLQWATASSTLFCGFIGKTRYVSGSVIIPTPEGMDDIVNNYPVEMSSVYNISNPSIALIASEDMEYTGMYYYDSSDNLNYPIIMWRRYIPDKEYPWSTDDYLLETLRLNTTLNMHGNSIIFSRSKQLLNDREDPLTNYQYQVVGTKLQSRYMHIYHTMPSEMGVIKRYGYSRWEDDVSSYGFIVGQI